MKVKKIFSIIMITVLCLGKVNAQTSGFNLSLSGQKTGNNLYEALINIESTQVIESGTTTYIAGNEINLLPGFEAKAGSEFEAVVGFDNFLNRLTIMTYNLQAKRYSRHAKVIKSSGAGVVSIQEIKGRRKYNTLKNETGFKGHFCPIFDIGVYA